MVTIFSSELSIFHDNSKFYLIFSTLPFAFRNYRLQALKISSINLIMTQYFIWVFFILFFCNIFYNVYISEIRPKSKQRLNNFYLYNFSFTTSFFGQLIFNQQQQYHYTLSSSKEFALLSKTRRKENKKQKIVHRTFSLKMFFFSFNSITLLLTKMVVYKCLKYKVPENIN